MKSTLEMPAVSTFRVLQSDSSGTEFWLLFVNERIPSDYDIQVIDYVGTYPNPNDAMKDYNDNYRDGTWPPALIARYDGNKLEIKYRVDQFEYDEPVPNSGGWFYAYDEDSYE